MKITVGSKLAVGFLLVSAILFIVAFIGIQGIKKIDKNIFSVTEQDWPAADAVMNIRISLLEKIQAQGLILEGKIEAASQILERVDKKFAENLATLRKVGLIAENKLEELEDLNKRLNEKGQEIITIYQKGQAVVSNPEKMAKIESVITSKAMEEFEMLSETMAPVFLELGNQTISKMRSAMRSSYSTVIATRFTLLIFTLVGLFLGALIGFVITKTITVPIIKLSKVTDLIAKGDLTTPVSIKRSDEIGLLANSFSIMLKNLSAILDKTKDAVNQINSASNEILAASQQQAAGAREQSSAISETTAAATELSKTAEYIGESIKRVSQVTSHAMAGMVKIKDAIGKTGEKIALLSEKSQEIGKITDIITDVADQTNLLAVNAAIEAARAGEQGRGFTVVADEIRKLADSTAKSTKDITALIEIIQHEMTNTIISMEQSVNNVNEEVRFAQESAESAKEISMAVTQQISGSKQIADAMGNINESMKDIASGAQQTQVAAKQLSSLAGELSNLISRFKVK